MHVTLVPPDLQCILCQICIQQKLQLFLIAHPHSELATRKYLDMYLASAFNLSLENGKLKAVDDHQYVLTLDYTLKVCVHHNRW